MGESVRKYVTWAVAAGAALGLSMAGAVPASAGSTGVQARCPATLNPVVNGGEAAWTIDCVGSKVHITGWVKDTKADGLCAFVKAFASFTDGSSRKEAKACPKGTTTRFAWEATGTEITAYLYLA